MHKVCAHKPKHRESTSNPLEPEGYHFDAVRDSCAGVASTNFRADQTMMFNNAPGRKEQYEIRSVSQGPARDYTKCGKHRGRNWRADKLRMLLGISSIGTMRKAPPNILVHIGRPRVCDQRWRAATYCGDMGAEQMQRCPPHIAPSTCWFHCQAHAPPTHVSTRPASALQALLI